MNCAEARESLAEQIFEGVERAAGLEAHLAGCVECRAEAAWLHEAHALTRGESAPPSEALRERVRAAVMRELGEKSPAPARGGFWSLLARPVPAYVAVAAALLGAVTVAGAMRATSPGATDQGLDPLRIPLAVEASSLFTAARSDLTGGRDAEARTAFADSATETPGADSL